MLIITVIIAWTIGIAIFINRKNLADIWLSFSAFFWGYSLLILFHSTLLNYYSINFSPSNYNTMCLIHSIGSAICSYLSPSVFAFFVLEFSGLMSSSSKFKKMVVYFTLLLPCLSLFWLYPANKYTYYFKGSQEYWHTMASLGLMYIIFYTSMLLVSLYKSDNPRDKRQNRLMCIFFIPLTVVVYIVSYVNIDGFLSKHGLLFWFFTVFIFIAVFIFLAVKYGFMGIKIKIEKYDSSIKQISEGTEILIHTLNREMAKIKASSINFREFGSHSDEVRKDIDNMNSSINHVCEMLKKVNNTLKNFHIDKTPQSLSVLIKTSINGIDNLAKEANTNIDFNPKDEFTVYCDKSLVIEVLKNILKNSIEALPINGKIEISLSKIRGYTCITIKDNGPGIPKDFIKKVFKFYFTTKENLRKNNYGLGLYFCKKIMLLHKGDIDINSSEGKGTTVFLYFKSDNFKKKGTTRYAQYKSFNHR